MMETLIEVGVVYLKTQTKTYTDKSGKQVSMKVGVYKFFVKYPNGQDKAGKITSMEQTVPEFTASKNNKFFVGISLDFERNKGVLNIRPFDKYNNRDDTRPLTIKTDGNVFVNRGFQLVTGDSSHAESTIHFVNNQGQTLQFHRSSKPTRQSS